MYQLLLAVPESSYLLYVSALLYEARMSDDVDDTTSRLTHATTSKCVVGG